MLALNKNSLVIISSLVKKNPKHRNIRWKSAATALNNFVVMSEMSVLFALSKKIKNRKHAKTFLSCLCDFYIAMSTEKSLLKRMIVILYQHYFRNCESEFLDLSSRL